MVAVSPKLLQRGRAYSVSLVLGMGLRRPRKGLRVDAGQDLPAIIRANRKLSAALLLSPSLDSLEGLDILDNDIPPGGGSSDALLLAVTLQDEETGI